VKRVLPKSSAFVRAAKKYLKAHPSAATDLESELQLLDADAFHPRLKTHKLTGLLKDSWASSAGYDFRIVFKFVAYEGSEAILLETAGTPDEVY
jgi:mRNA-degrading endonuclease YafQ of YafQ-DinJ toxin-antitoxin module